MLDKETRGAILLLRRKGHSLRCISRLLSLSRCSVRKVVRVGSDEPPIIVRPRKPDAHRERIAQMLAKFDGNVAKVHRALADAGMTVRYSSLTAFCRKNHLSEGTCDPRRSVVAARQWLLELVNGTHSVERLQSQLSAAADLPFLFSQLKHGRSRHRKKAATILARKRGISNSVIAGALRSSRSTTRRYYRMYLEAGRKISSRGIRLVTRAQNTSSPSEQNASSKLSIISQPPLASTARLGRSPHYLKPTSNHTARSFPEALLPESCGALVTDGERRDECLQAQIRIITKRSSCC
jgi:hypothetical protein